MPFGELGAFLLVLVVAFVLGRLWFHLVEGVLNRVRALFSRRKPPPPWHPLPHSREEDPRD